MRISVLVSEVVERVRQSTGPGLVGIQTEAHEERL